MSNIELHPLRLKPGADLKKSIQEYVNAHKIGAGWVASCAGSLTRYHIRFANQPEGVSDSGHFEIVSLSGTVSDSGSHLHIAVSDSIGKTVGGHLLEGCIVYTTAELILQSSADYQFTREKDGSTEWPELQIHRQHAGKKREN